MVSKACWLVGFVVVSGVVMGVLSACGDDPAGTDQNQPQVVSTTTVPENLSWSIGPAGLNQPKNTVDGPFQSSPVPHGFSATPQGALLAAITAQVWMAGADDKAFPEVANHLLEPGPGRDQWVQARALVTVDGRVTHPPLFAGFKFTEYTPDKAVILIAVKQPDGAITAYPVQVSHSSGDWRVVNPTQDAAPDLVEITADQLNKEFIPL